MDNIELFGWHKFAPTGKRVLMLFMIARMNNPHVDDELAIAQIVLRLSPGAEFVYLTKLEYELNWHLNLLPDRERGVDDENRTLFADQVP